MKQREIETLIHYPVAIPRQPALAATSPAMCPIADSCARKSCRCRCIRAFWMRPWPPWLRRHRLSGGDRRLTKDLIIGLSHHMRRTLLLTLALSVAAAWPAGAQNLKVEFHDGRVSVEATSVPVRAILTEWGKIGGTKIVGVEQNQRRADHREVDQRDRGAGARNDPAQRRGLHGRAAQRRSRCVDVRPHHGDGDELPLRRPSRPTRARRRSNQAPPSTARNVSFRRASGRNRPSLQSRTSRMKIHRTHRCSLSRSRARAAS